MAFAVVSPRECGIPLSRLSSFCLLAPLVVLYLVSKWGPVLTKGRGEMSWHDRAADYRVGQEPLLLAFVSYQTFRWYWKLTWTWEVCRSILTVRRDALLQAVLLIWCPDIMRHPSSPQMSTFSLRLQGCHFWATVLYWWLFPSPFTTLTRPRTIRVSSGVYLLVHVFSYNVSLRHLIEGQGGGRHST